MTISSQLLLTHAELDSRIYIYFIAEKWKNFFFFFFVWFAGCTKGTELLALNEVKLKGMEGGQQAGKEKHKHLNRKK